jgi:CRP/FNR family cyclic AMP-dependent transcriptional regulator
MAIDGPALVGLLGMVLVCLSYAMRHMLPLRALASLGNVCLIVYGYMEWQLPALAINAILLPLNLRNLWEIVRVSREIRRVSHLQPISKWLLPNMRRRRCAAGEVLFRQGEPADELVYVATGTLRMVESGRVLGAGELVGEIGLFSPERRRTQTIVCDTDGELYHMSDEMIFQLYYKNPRLGFYLMRTIVERLLRDADRHHGRAVPT